MGRRVVNFRLKDWLVSRQRYWGTPIPMVHCPAHGVVPVPEEQLPVLLPEDVKDYKPKGKSVLEGVESFINTTCPKCGGPARRDPDTMDTFVDSSWYHLRYTDAHNSQLPFRRSEADKWLPIDEYIGGIEHATGHLIFFRFFTRALHDMGMLAVEEPCMTLHTQGMVSLDGVTMSSSKRVGVWVGEFVPEHGADVGRLAVLFAAPPEKGMDWTDDLVTGVTRFVNRLWRLYEDNPGLRGVPVQHGHRGADGVSERPFSVRRPGFSGVRVCSWAAHLPAGAVHAASRRGVVAPFASRRGFAFRGAVPGR
jgi:leucyl-tRNA synthetase